MSRKFLLQILIISLLLSFWNVNGYSFWSKPKPESLKSYNRAHEFYLDKKYTKAEKEYLYFIKKHPDSLLVEAATYYTAKCYSELKNYDRAQSYYKQVIDNYKEGFWVDSAKDEIVKLEAMKKGD